MAENEILTKIIKKGGLLGSIAKVWSNDKVKATQFIKECSEMCHTPMARDLWGNELIQAIKRYSMIRSFQSRKINNLDSQITKTIKALRISKGPKQDVIAQALGVTQSYYCKIEKGIKPLTAAQLLIISKELHISVSDIFNFVDTKL